MAQVNGLAIRVRHLMQLALLESALCLQIEDDRRQIAVEDFLEKLAGRDLRPLAPALRQFGLVMVLQRPFADVDDSGDLGIAEPPHRIELDVGARCIVGDVRFLLALARQRALAAIFARRRSFVCVILGHAANVVRARGRVESGP